MAQNIGTLVTAAIRPNDSLDLIASAYANEIKGGLHTVTSSSDRNNIMSVRREWGMLCYVTDDNKTYQLSYNYASSIINDNANWIEFSGSGGSGGSGEWLNSVLSVLTTEPSTPSDGDRYILGTGSSSIISGSNWSSQVGGVISQWNSNLLDWNYTIPTNGSSVRVDDQESSIYRYRGDYPSGTWQKERESQVRYINAELINGGSYSAVSSPFLLDYEEEALYIVKFNNPNVGASVSLSINNLPHKLVRKTDGISLTNIITDEITTSYQYLITYNNSSFELLNPSATSTGTSLSNQHHIADGQTVIVPADNQYFIYGNLSVDGVLSNYGHVVVANGSLNIGNGQFNDYGTYSNIYFAEINGLGETNYVPRWVTPYMLTANSSIYDDGNKVEISSQTFSVLNELVIPTGATNGYVLTSDNDGLATWQEMQGIKKYSATFSFISNATQSITHNLNSSDIIFTFWNEDTGTTDIVNVVKTSLNTIDVMSTVTINNGRVVIMS
jgi:hypothetical protein